MVDDGLKIYSRVAWQIASHFSNVLASDTRTLASMIDDALELERGHAKQQADALAGAADRARAAMWDSYYGKGIGADYARSVDEKVAAALRAYREGKQK